MNAGGETKPTATMHETQHRGFKTVKSAPAS